MENWREIKSDIEDALENADLSCDVYYHKPEGRGDDSCCGYFEVSLDDDDWEWEWVEDALEEVMNEWDLYIDDDSDEDFDLNADWDTND